ncbi:MAG: hypothetical protein IIT72_01270, partial [Lachnospiraceae bacterium]|nr:hypothetical protein [Lachnospiraceae bacterium]
MITLILGEPDSGKSALAEKLVCKMASSLPDSCQKIYLATMIPYGKEGDDTILSIMMEELSLLSCSCTHLCIVSNEFPLMEEG